jgi:single-stranded DNA-binding protein
MGCFAQWPSDRARLWTSLSCRYIEGEKSYRQFTQQNGALQIRMSSCAEAARGGTPNMRWGGNRQFYARFEPKRPLKRTSNQASIHQNRPIVTAPNERCSCGAG